MFLIIFAAIILLLITRPFSNNYREKRSLNLKKKKL